MFPTLYKAGARIFSNSWGTPGSNVYTDKCYDADNYIYNNPDVLVVFAVGNSGADGAYSGFLIF
jgi:subtilisin family serine protease